MGRERDKAFGNIDWVTKRLDELEGLAKRNPLMSELHGIAKYYMEKVREGDGVD